MATAKKSPARKAALAKPKDAVSLLKADHKAVDVLFAEFAKSRSPTRKKSLVQKMCLELSVHAQIEEEIFYPAVKAALKDKKLVPEALVEQATLKALIGQIEGVEPDGEMYDAKVMVLCEYVKHHVKEEHTEMFPKAKASKLNLMALGAELAARKEALLAGKR
jgi:hemerythrin superfamily protein